MTNVKLIAAIALMSILFAGTVEAQSEYRNNYPDAYEAENPNRNLNDTLTPAGRMGLELPEGAAPAYGDKAMTTR